MISKLNLSNLRNAEHIQFICSACDIFMKFGIDIDNLRPLYDMLNELRNSEEVAFAAEKGNEKIREKNEMDGYRDKLHSKLFNYVKSIVYDEKDIRFDAAQRVMKIIKETGNPTDLAENAESAELNKLGSRLETHRTDVEAIGAQEIVDALMDANWQFIVLEKECREVASAQQAVKSPAMNAIRKQADPVYRAIVNAINGYANVPSKKEAYKDIVIEMNTLVKKYDDLLSGRGGKKDEEKK